jgi:hypothetical protein
MLFFNRLYITGQQKRSVYTLPVVDKSRKRQNRGFSFEISN